MRHLFILVDQQTPKVVLPLRTTLIPDLATILVTSLAGAKLTSAGSLPIR